MSSTKGEFRVGIDFNPSGDDLVNRLKRAAADLIDLVDEIPSDNDGERLRLKALAQTEIESAAMWAVKAATKKPNPGFDTGALGPGRPAVDMFQRVVNDVVARGGAPETMSRRERIALEDAVRLALQQHGFRNVSDEQINIALANAPTGA